MNNLQIFNNDQFGQIRTTVKDGAPLFVAADVCRALEISNSRMATDRLDDDEKADVSLTEMPKNLDGYKDETNEEYLQRIKNKTEEIRQNENAAVIEAESNEEIEQILRRL